MKNKIGVIGNSHLAAFKLGWEIIKSDFPNIDLVFFGSPATTMRSFEINENGLFPKTDILKENIKWTSDGFEYIPKDMSGYILVGMGYSFLHLLALQKVHRLFDYYDENSTHQLISESYFNKAMEGTLYNSNASTIVDMLKQITDAPMYYAPNPYPSISVVDDSSDKYEYFKFTEIMERAFRYYNESVDTVFTDKGVRFFSQPEETIVNSMFTRERYSKNSVKLKRGLKALHDPQDYFHMNDQFGAMSLRDILSSSVFCL